MRNVTRTPAAPKFPNIENVALTRQEISERFDEELKRRYWGEKALLELLPNLARAATSYELVTALENHLKVTGHQIDRLLHVFDSLGERALLSRYEIMENLIGNAHQAIDFKIGYERDQAIVTIAKRIMLHEIAVYEKMRAYSRVLEESQATEYISQAIAEEKAAHDLLTELELKSIYSD